MIRFLRRAHKHPDTSLWVAYIVYGLLATFCIAAREWPGLLGVLTGWMIYMMVRYQSIRALDAQTDALIADRRAVEAEQRVKLVTEARERDTQLISELTARANMKQNTVEDDVRHMCEAFGQTISDTPHLPADHVRALRIALMTEEFQEYIDAEKAGDLVAIADALTDMQVIGYGTAGLYGFRLDDCHREVYRSNLTKVRSDGTVERRADGKVLKPEGYEPPNLARVLGLDTEDGEVADGGGEVIEGELMAS